MHSLGVEPWNSWGAKGAGRCCSLVTRPQALGALCQRAPGGIPAGIIHEALSQQQVPECLQLDPGEGWKALEHTRVLESQSLEVFKKTCGCGTWGRSGTG